MDDLIEIEAEIDSLLERLEKHIGDEISEPTARAEFISSVLCRYVNYKIGNLQGASDNFLFLASQDVKEIGELMAMEREDFCEDYGAEAGDLLASLNAAAQVGIPLQACDRRQIGVALFRYLSKQDAFFGEAAGLRKQAKKPFGARDGAVAFEVYYQYWKNPNIKLSKSVKSTDGISAYELVGEMFHLSASAVEKIFRQEYSNEERELLKKRAKERRRRFLKKTTI